jgi:hypothetical protein
MHASGPDYFQRVVSSVPHQHTIAVWFASQNLLAVAAAAASHQHIHCRSSCVVINRLVSISTKMLVRSLFDAELLLILSV